MISLVQIALTLPLIASAVSADPVILKQRQTHPERLVTPRPQLNQAAYFTLLTKTGISVVPTVTIDGNIGVAPVAMSYMTGLSLEESADFDHAVAAQVNNGFLFAGDSKNSPPHSAGHAVDAMMTTYDEIMGLSGSEEPEKAGGILDSLTLTAGLYSWSTAVVLHADQILTLSGSATDVFVLQASGAFLFQAASKIVLEGSVNPANIFFATSTSFSTGAGAKIFGNIMTGTNVVLGDNTVLVGGVYAQTELAIAKGVTVTSSSPQCTHEIPGLNCQ